MPSHWGKSHLNPIHIKPRHFLPLLAAEGRDEVRLRIACRLTKPLILPLSQRERERGVAGCSCPRLCVIIIVQCYSMESGSVERTQTLHRGKPMRRVFHLSWVILLLALAPAYAEIYKWVDHDGRVHFSDTLAGIPPEHRDRIEEKAGLTSTSRSAPAPRRVTPERRPSVPAPLSYVVPLRRDGNAMLVEALVSGTVRTHLLLDTGAEFTVLSTAVARRLALNLGSAAV